MAEKQRIYPCNTCSITFTTSESQRAHMHQDWHVANLRRKIAGLPAEPEPLETAVQNESKEPTNRRKHSDETPRQNSPRESSRNSPEPSSSHTKDTEAHLPPATYCLFCPIVSDSLDANITHMSTTHGLYIPSPDRLYDLESFLTYLGRLVFEWHECLYCGVEKGSLEGVQTHMRDKGHCKVKMEDMQEFWEEESGTEEDDEEEVNKRAGKKESVSKPRRRDTTKPRRTHRHTALITTFKSTSSPPSPTAPDTQASHNTHLSLHTPKTALSLAGLSNHDKRLLHATDKKMATKAALAQARNKQRMVMAPVLTKYYKTENPVYMAG